MSRESRRLSDYRAAGGPVPLGALASHCAVPRTEQPPNAMDLGAASRLLEPACHVEVPGQQARRHPGPPPDELVALVACLSLWKELGEPCARALQPNLPKPSDLQHRSRRPRTGRRMGLENEILHLAAGHAVPAILPDAAGVAPDRGGPVRSVAARLCQAAPEIIPSSGDAA